MRQRSLVFIQVLWEGQQLTQTFHLTIRHNFIKHFYIFYSLRHKICPAAPRGNARRRRPPHDIRQAFKSNQMAQSTLLLENNTLSNLIFKYQTSALTTFTASCTSSLLPIAESLSYSFYQYIDCIMRKVLKLKFMFSV